MKQKYAFAPSVSSYDGWRRIIANRFYSSQLVGQDAWKLADFLIAKNPAVDYTSYVNQFKFFQYKGGELQGWAAFSESDYYPENDKYANVYPPVGDYLESHALLIIWRVFDRLVQEQTISLLRLAKPFRFGYNFHDGEVVVVRIIN